MEEILSLLDKINNDFVPDLEKGIGEAIRGEMVELAASTPYDTGYHAINWQIGNQANENEIEPYDKKNKRDFQAVLNNVSERTEDVIIDINHDLYVFNNGKMIKELENGTPTAGTGPNANPGFVQNAENELPDIIQEVINNVLQEYGLN